MKLTIYSSEGILPTDSTEYELLIAAAKEASKVEGMSCELGLRRGGGTRMILDTFLEAGVYKNHVAVDPWGDIEYLTTEKNHVRLATDYTNSMRNTCMVELFTYYMDKPVNVKVENMTDEEFFKRFPDYVPFYDNKGRVDEKFYCIAHLDGPHDSDVVINEARFFSPRMKKGAMLVCDDTNLYDHARAEKVILEELGFEIAARGQRKLVYRKL